MNQSITQNSQNEKKISNSMKRRKKAKININLVVYVLLFFFAGLVIILAWSQSSQSHMAVPLPLKFVGEYCQNNGEWKTLEENTRVSAYDGELKLCGRFNLELPEGAEMKCYLNHIGMVMYLNGERVLETSYEKYPDMCGSVWGMWELPLMSAGDEIEIRLKNPHCYGNADAYNEFLDSLYMSGSEVLKEFYEQEELPYRSFCVFILVVSVALIGTAAGYQLLGLPNRCLLLKLGVLSLLMGIYIYFDARDISMQSDSVVFNTYVRQISMMLAFCMLGAAAVELLKEKRKKMAEIIVYVLMAADFASMALSLAGKVRIYDTGFFLAVIQGIVGLVLAALCILEMKNQRKREWFLLISAELLFLVWLVELFNARFCWWKNGTSLKAVFGVLFVCHLFWAVRQVSVNYQASIRAKRLEKELKENQISLAMSQIQPHFIYNALNSIFHLCDKDVEMAKQAISDFSEYLQRSLSAVNSKALISFEEEFRHVKTYLKLEQLRFGSDLKVEYHIETTGFMLPALSVQPLVENAVKHGICRKEELLFLQRKKWKTLTKSQYPMTELVLFPEQRRKVPEPRWVSRMCARGLTPCVTQSLRL